MLMQKMILNKLVDVVLKQVTKRFKLKKVLDYVEKPNDADDRIDKLELDVHSLKKDTHPPIFSTKDYKSLLKRISKLEKRRK
tara:strand:- start:1032 stop:1277 length:246 start_codon:yes stop_codon:yes gene_type:complete